MNHAQRQAIITRAFVATGKDGLDGFVQYVDQLERAVLSMDKMYLNRRRMKSRKDLEEIMRLHSIRFKTYFTYDDAL